MQKIEEAKFKEIAFTVLETDDDKQRILFEVGDFNLYEYFLFSYANAKFLIDNDDKSEDI
jgi:hypothetical protein